MGQTLSNICSSLCGDGTHESEEETLLQPNIPNYESAANISQNCKGILSAMSHESKSHSKKNILLPTVTVASNIDVSFAATFRLQNLHKLGLQISEDSHVLEKQEKALEELKEELCTLQDVERISYNDSNNSSMVAYKVNSGKTAGFDVLQLSPATSEYNIILSCNTIDALRVSPGAHFQESTQRLSQPKRKNSKRSKKGEGDKNVCGSSIQVKWIKHYNRNHKILLVGEGDFSFSACLAIAFESAPNMVATSLNSIGFLSENYACALNNIEQLNLRGCKVMHGVDATLIGKKKCSFRGKTFDRIIFNFPHAGFSNKLSEEELIHRHQKLIRSFMKCGMKLLSDDGEIHISHKSNGYHKHWNLEQLASEVGLRLIEAVPFKLSHYPEYNTKYGFGGDKNFNCKPSKTYKFGI